MKGILGISAYYHDSAAAIVVDGEIVAAVQEERFTRKKHTPDFPINAIQYCLEESGLSIDELAAVIFYDKPFLKFERLLETYYTFSPKGILSFLKAIPVWLREKLFLKKQIYDGLKKIEPYDKKKLRLLFSEHHLSHAASAFFASNYDEAAILTIDGVGEWSTSTIGIGKENNIRTLKELEFPHSVGLLYSAFTYYLGFKVNSGEYKLMGLAPYGISDSDEVKKFKEKIQAALIDIKPDGSIWLNQDYFSYATGLKMTKDKKWKELFGFPRRLPESKLEQFHCNLAMAIQHVIETIVLKMAKTAKDLSNLDRLCMAGGVALNCVSNGKLLKSKLFKEIYIQPAAGDAGGALGAALAAYHLYFEEPRTYSSDYDLMKGAYLGPGYSRKEIEFINRKNKAVYREVTDHLKLTEFVARKIADGCIVGWYQGRMEYGPRALGNRSILGDARNPRMQNKINQSIKYRENFRPFAPSVLEEDASLYFDCDAASPYMLFTASVLEERRMKLPEDYDLLPIKERLGIKRSDIPSVTHLDFSSRVQTVSKATNPKFHKLLQAFKNITNHGILINTSFNIRGQPIVLTPMDAYICFMATEMAVSYTHLTLPTKRIV